MFHQNFEIEFTQRSNDREGKQAKRHARVWILSSMTVTFGKSHTQHNRNSGGCLGKVSLLLNGTLIVAVPAVYQVKSISTNIFLILISGILTINIQALQ